MESRIRLLEKELEDMYNQKNKLTLNNSNIVNKYNELVKIFFDSKAKDINISLSWIYIDYLDLILDHFPIDLNS